MVKLECTYAGEPRERIDDAIAKTVAVHGGTVGDTGWGFNERDVSVRFAKEPTPDDVIWMESALRLLGCFDVRWRSR